MAATYSVSVFFCLFMSGYSSPSARKGTRRVPNTSTHAREKVNLSPCEQGIGAKWTFLSRILFLGNLLGSGRHQFVALLGVLLRGFGIVMNCMLIVSVSEVGVVRSLFVLLGLVVFRCLFLMESRPLMMTGGMMVVLPSL
jgi:hypothetical protein